MKKFAQRPYYAMSSHATLAYLQSAKTGLSDFDASGRLAVFGKNVLQTKKRISRVMLFVRQFYNPLIHIILIAAIILYCVGHAIDALFIVIAILINAFFSFLQEDKAERMLQHLKGEMRHCVRVVRNGQKKRIPSSDLVVGDIVDVIAGDRIAADGRLVTICDLYVNEVAVTGEWQEVQKTVAKIDQGAIISDQRNKIFAGSLVTQGCGTYVVTATGVDSEIGKISPFMEEISQEQTSLQKKFRHFSLIISSVILTTVTVFSVIGIMRGQLFVEIFIISIALTVSAMPGGLFSSITVILTFGMCRIAKCRSLVRRLNVSEMIGAITVICTDKTGTLTKGNMTVSHILSGANELLDFDERSFKKYHDHNDLIGHIKVLQIGALVNDAYVENLIDPMAKPIIHGRPTDRALLMSAVKVGIDVDGYRAKYALISQEFFKSDSACAVRVHEIENGKVRIMVLGAPEKVLLHTSYIDVHGIRMSFNSTEGKKLTRTLEELASRGLRVLACAERILTRDTYDRLKRQDRYNDLSLVGCIALKDPLRDNVEASLQKAEQAGMRLVLITGDHPNTARAVMMELGHNVSAGMLCTGREVDDMDEMRLRNIVNYVKVFARVLPEHKIRIVRALQSNGDVVAMVGNGIDDASAIKAADIGISTGESADIAKEVSDIVLIDNGLGTVISAVEQGRVIYENIRRIVISFIVDNFSMIFLFFCAVIFGWPLPLSVIQILWINIIKNGFSNIALTTEYDSKNLMFDPPRKVNETMISTPYKYFISVVLLVSGTIAVLTFWFLQISIGDVVLSRTVVFVLIAFDSLIFVYVIRSMRQSIFRKDIFDNKYINGAALLSGALLIFGIYMPPLAHFLGVVPMSGILWGVVVAVASIEVVIFEISKYFLLIRPLRPGS